MKTRIYYRAKQKVRSREQMVFRFIWTTKKLGVNHATLATRVHRPDLDGSSGRRRPARVAHNSRETKLNKHRH